MSDNPPAFPVPEVRDHEGCGIREGSDGMSLRDYFAACAIPACYAVDYGNDWGKAGIGHPPAAARAAYRMADAMLAARTPATQEGSE